MDKLLSIVMAIVLLFTAVANVIPVESQATDLKNTTLDSDISIKGTNSFGNMLSAELDSEVEEQEENNGYNVFSAEVAGTEVAVSFETMSDCTLLAAIYDEAGEKLIASGTAQVTEEEIEKTVTIEIDEMPQYFYLKVYLVDENTLRPMCTAYESPNYTQEMQEFFALTVDDFESDRVLNLDEDEINNFAVYGEDVIIIESDETVNTVTVADIDNENYVIENADSTVTSLQIGDVFVIEQTSGEILIVKVGEIIVDGTTATITGEDTEMEEVFEIVKIDTTQTNEEATVDTSDMSQGVTYEGETNKIQPLTARAKKSSGGDTATTSLKFSFKFLEGNSDDGSTSGSLSGSVSLSSTLNLKYYISWSRQYAEFKFNDEFNFSVAFSGEMKKEFKLGKVDFALCPGLYVSMVPKVVFEFSLSTHIDFTVENIRGFSVEHTKKGFEKKNIGKKPKMKSISLTVEGALSVGVSISADICLVHRNIFRAGFEASAKFELSLEESKRLLSSEHPDSKHTCRECLEGDLSVKTEISFNVTFLNSKKLSLKWVIASKEAKLSDIYFSFDNMKGELTTCPYYAYRTDFEITDSDGNAIEGLTLEIRDMRTNKWLDGINGTKNIYLLGGRSYHVRIYYNGIKYEDIFKVKKAAKRVVLKIDNDNSSAPVTTVSSTTTEKTTTETTTTTTDSSVVASGTCGENLTWVLDDEGTLTISGTGDMEDFKYYPYSPWNDYDDSIMNVIIENGVTSIGNSAFEDCSSLTSITISDSVTSIENDAFWNCYSLTTITIPDSVTSIGVRAFHGCDSLTAINVDADNGYYTSEDGVLFNKDMTMLIHYLIGKTDESYSIPDSVTSIGSYAFEICSALTEITIPDSVTSIGDYAFAWCDSLTTITIPDSVTSIGDYAFRYCSLLKTIDVDADNGYYTSLDGVLFNKDMTLLIQYPIEKTDESYSIPDSVTSIGDSAFEDCHSLTSITIPDSVTSIGVRALGSCSELSTITISDSVISIGEDAFIFCGALSSVTIGNSVTSIGEDAFAWCDSLTTITIPDSVISIGTDAFYSCDALTTLTLGKGVKSIGNYAFNGISALTNIYVDEDNSNYTSVDGVLFSKDMTKLVQYPVGRTDEAYTIPESVTCIGRYSFYACKTLTSMEIPDNVTTIEDYAFSNCIAITTVTIPESVIRIEGAAFACWYALTDVYYSGTEEQWNEIIIDSGNEDLTDAIIHYNSSGSQSTASLLTMTKKSAKESALLAESFTDLLPNEVYNFYVMKSRAAESIFSGGNLLYVTQAVSDENGELTISYIPKEAFEIADIFVAGLTRTDISAAEATVPEITYIGEEILVNPEVTLNGQALIEGIDYDIEGGYLVTQPGDYTITIVGNGDYIGEKDIMFTAICIHSYDGQICMICGNKNPDILEFLLGDVNNDGSVDSSDASLVLAEYAKIQTGGAGEFSENQLKAADVNNDSVVDSSDASKILAYYAMVSTGKEPTWD